MAVPCPKCKVALPKGGVSECPSCGAKLKAKKKRKQKKKADPLESGTTRRIVRKKSAIPSFDDSQVFESQRAEYEKYQESEPAKAPASKETGRKRAKKKKTSETSRRRSEQMAKLEAERDALDNERRRLKEEKQRLAAERQLDEERAKLEDEKQRLEEEKQSRQIALEKKKQAAKSRRNKKKAAAPPPEPDEDLPAWGEPVSKPKTPTKAPAKKSMVDQAPARQKAVAGSSTAVADRQESPAAVTVVKPETVGDWVEDFKGVNWGKISFQFGIPGAIFVILVFFWGGSITYGVVDLPRIKARKFVYNTPKPGGFPYAKPPTPPGKTWLPIGPIQILVPSEGPIHVNWDRPGSAIKFEEQVTLVFRGWQIICERYGRDALVSWLSDDVPDSLLEDCASDRKPDAKLVKYFLDLTPDAYSYFQAPDGMKRFQSGIYLKLHQFPEIKSGLVEVAFADTEGYFFGAVAKGRQRFELFDKQGRRYSYRISGESDLTALKWAQPALEPHWQAWNDQQMKWYDLAEDPARPFALFKAAMWAAGGSIANRASSSQVSQIRVFLTASELNPLGGGKNAKDKTGEEAAREAFDAGHSKYLKIKQKVAEKTASEGDLRRARSVYEMMLRLLVDPRRHVRERMRRYFKELMEYEIGPGKAGIRQVEEWVKRK